MEASEITLGSVPETLLLPLWGRAVETQKKKPLLVDPLAVNIIRTIGYDFSTIENKISPLSRAAWVARSVYFDTQIKAFLEVHPTGSVVNIGCGLDTTYERVNNGGAMWYELELPDVIALRRKYIKESDKRVFIAESALEDGWYGTVKNREHVLLLLAGVIYYFDEKEVMKLFADIQKHFRHSTVLFDYCSVKGMQIANKRVIEDGGMSCSANLVWGIDDIEEIEEWGHDIRVVEMMPMFRNHKKNYPVVKRIGMNISDRIKVMALAKVEIGG